MYRCASVFIAADGPVRRTRASSNQLVWHFAVLLFVESVRVCVCVFRMSECVRVRAYRRRHYPVKLMGAAHVRIPHKQPPRHHPYHADCVLCILKFIRFFLLLVVVGVVVVATSGENRWGTTLSIWP